MVTRLVRLAISSEYTRQPLKRTDISSKGLRHSRRFLFYYDAFVNGTPVLGRTFKEVFARAQKKLQRVFGLAEGVLSMLRAVRILPSITQ